MAPTPIGVIRQSATRYGLDPASVLAYALTQGGTSWGAVGDQGTSFGPFQAHIGGAAGNRTPQAAASWANSPQGIDQMVGMMARGWQGPKTGPDAAAFIVGPHFGRGANPASDIAKARAAYPRAQALLGGQAPSTSPVSSAMAPAAPPQLPSAAPPSRPQLPQAVIQALRVLGGGSPALAQQLAGLSAPAPPAVAAPPSRTRPQAPRSPMRQPRAEVKTAAGFAPTMGKLIGTPYEGTHAKAFNVSGGSDNWESENAVDVAVPVGTPIRAPFTGTIGSQFGSLGSGGRFAGLRLHVQGRGNEAYLAHLSRFAPGIQPGVTVKAGQVVGYSGEANGVAHLHFGLRSGNPSSFYSKGAT